VEILSPASCCQLGHFWRLLEETRVWTREERLADQCSSECETHIIGQLGRKHPGGRTLGPDKARGRRPDCGPRCQVQRLDGSLRGQAGRRMEGAAASREANKLKLLEVCAPKLKAERIDSQGLELQLDAIRGKA